MAAFILVDKDSPFPVLNIVEFGAQVPPDRDENGDYWVPYTSEIVGDPFDLTGWLTAQARADAEAQLNSTDFIGKAMRSAVDLSVTQFNLHRADVIGMASQVWDPANMANGTGATSPNFTVTGARLANGGNPTDEVSVLAPYTLQGIIATGYVSATDTVVVRLHNGTGGAINLASGTWTVAVYRPVARPQLTLTQGLNAMIAKIAAGGVD